MARRVWTREESILALALYCKIPFGKINHTHPQVIQLAALIGRSPAAVSMKMDNFGRFDPELQARNITGLKNGSALDELIWNEFHQNMEKLFEEADHTKGFSNILMPEKDFTLPAGEESLVLSKKRKGQSFFRSTVLSAYNNTCCISGLTVPELLQASHIKSWKDSDAETERTNPINGLCMNPLHHKAFDEGLFTIDTCYQIILSKSLKEHFTNDAFHEYFSKYDGKKILLPVRFLPDKIFIQYHNEHLPHFFDI